MRKTTSIPCPSGALAAMALVAAVAVGTGVSAQDVEELGRHYGTRPPAEYFETLASDAGAFRFHRGRTARLAARAAAEALDPGRPHALGPRDGVVQGTFRIPVVLGLFADSPPLDELPFAGPDVQLAFFDAPTGTVTSYYDEISAGRVDLVGEVRDWARTSRERSQVTRGSGLVSNTVGPFILDILGQMAPIDWGVYDNDGPDGVPNSGDDDGFVDALAVIHPTAGAECGGEDRVWSHKWSLRYAGGGVFTTTTAAAGGGFIQVDDYFVQPILDCGEEGLATIGVFAHEAGHAFGLPDLYDTNEHLDGRHAGAGNWELMSSGSYGCDGGTPESPCHMGAWSKAQLGWVDVVTLAPGADHGVLTLEPVETTGRVYRVDTDDGSGDYFLLENRQRIGFDQHLLGEGLLVWQVDPGWVARHWSSNLVNAYQHRGVWLRQADGLDELGTPGKGRGDADDPYPYEGPGEENRSFHAGSTPASHTSDGNQSGLTIFDAERVGDDVRFRLLTRFTRVSMRTEGSVTMDGIFTVDGAPLAGALVDFDSAPFAAHAITAAAGESLGPGVRTPFSGWDDDPAAPRSRTLVVPLEDTEYVARYTGRQFELAVESEGGVSGVEPGVFTSEPASEDLWFAEGEAVTLTAEATTGFAFVRWTGALAGRPNPASLTMSAPVQAGATFELTYALPSLPVELPAATSQDIQLEVENGTDPVLWFSLGGELPAGLDLDAFGRLTGAALEVGDFPVELRATDVRGLVAEGTVLFRVGRPDFGIERLASLFFGFGPPLDAIQSEFLDRLGNANGRYDLGDFRAWVLANPELPYTSIVKSLLGPRTVVVPLRPLRSSPSGLVGREEKP